MSPASGVAKPRVQLWTLAKPHCQRMVVTAGRSLYLRGFELFPLLLVPVPVENFAIRRGTQIIAPAPFREFNLFIPRPFPSVDLVCVRSRWDGLRKRRGYDYGRQGGVGRL
jgi:hypothetical protein